MNPIKWGEPIPAPAPAVEVPEKQGSILHLQRLSTEDGPGIRTTVFFKGCPLHCAWCHNPESIPLEQQVQWLESRCIGCLTCLAACPQAALRRVHGQLVRDGERCMVCGECAEACPTNAQELLGRAVSVVELTTELLKDRAYYEKSGGGVTLSGGEPSLQPAFALALLEGLQAAGIPTALDTCGLCSRENLENLVEHSDLILFDLKHIDTQMHQQFTGVGNERILANLDWLAGWLTDHPAVRLWIRTPLIPGATLTQENIMGIGAWLAEHLPGRVERWELCAFNNLCRDQYTRLGLEWEFASTPLLSRSEMDQAGGWARQSGFALERVFVTGAARIEV